MATKSKNGVKPQTTIQGQDTFEAEPNTLIVEDQSLRYGFIQLPKQILYARNLSHAAKLLYAVLLGYAWQESSCFPGYGRLQEDMQAGEKMIRRYMRELQEIGLLSQKRRGQGKTNIYTLHDLRSVRFDLPASFKIQNRQNDRSRTAQKSALEPSNRLGNNKQSNNKQSKQYNDVVMASLQKFGVSNSAATKLAKTYPESYIRDKLEFVQYLASTGSPLVKKNPAGFLRKAIEEDYDPPADFETTSQREAREVRQRKSAQAAVEQRRLAEEQFRQARKQAKQHLLDQHPPQPVGENGLDTQSAWELTLQKLQAEVPKPTFETWLKDTLLLNMAENTAYVMVPSTFAGEWLERRMYQSIARTLGNVLHQEVGVEFVAAQPAG